MNTTERWAISFMDRMNTQQLTNTRHIEEISNVPQQRMARDKQPMQINGHSNGQTSNQNYERPSPQPWYEPLSRPVANQNASLLNSEAMQIGGYGPTQENGIRMFPNPMFEAIPGTRGSLILCSNLYPGG